MHLVSKRGYVCVSEVSYTEEGQEFSLKDDEIEQNKHLFKSFREGKPIIRVYVKDLTEELKAFGK